jgi:hypothetical protein
MNNIDPKRNWPEDYYHENGEYYCRCHVCNNMFIGYKRRVVCKICSEKNNKKEIAKSSGYSRIGLNNV